MIPFVVGAALVQAMAAAPVPFAVGERFDYAPYYSLNPFGAVGTVTMTVAGIDTVRGVPSWHFIMTSNLNAKIYKANSRLESWTTVNDFVSRRFIHFVNEKGKQYADEDIQIHADSGYFRNRTDTIVKPVCHATLSMTWLSSIKSGHWSSRTAQPIPDAAVLPSGP